MNTRPPFAEVRSRRGPARLVAACSIALSILACSGDSNTPLGPPPPAGFSATGDWTYTSQLADNKDGITCGISGLLHLRQTGSSLAGTVYANSVCQGNGVTSDTGTASIASGSLSGAAVAIDVGGCRYAGQVYMAGSTPNASGTESCRVPVGAGQSITLTGTFVATFVHDVTPPMVQGRITYPLDDTLAIAGDQLSVQVDGADNIALAWVGYETGAPLNLRDSTAVTGPMATGTFTIGAPASGPVAVTLFARDSAGLRAAISSAPIQVLAGYVRRPTIALPLAAAVQDIAIDSARKLAYLAVAGQRQVGVVDIASRAARAGIALPFPGISVDVTRGGDSLLVAADSAGAMAVVRLSTGAISTITLAQPSGFTLWSYRVRALANDKAIVTLSDCCSGYVVAVDLSTGASVVRQDAGYAHLTGGISYHTTLARTPDRQVLMYGWACCIPFVAQKYLAASDSFTPVATNYVIATLVRDMAPDRTGSAILLANNLLDATFAPIWTFTAPDLTVDGAATLTPDGATAYYTTTYGYLKLRTSDQVVLERIRLPGTMRKVTLSSDGNTLIAASGAPGDYRPNYRLFLVDLR